MSLTEGKRLKQPGKMLGNIKNDGSENQQRHNLRSSMDEGGKTIGRHAIILSDENQRETDTGELKESETYRVNRRVDNLPNNAGAHAVSTNE